MYEIYVFNSTVGEFVFFDDYADSSVKTCLDAFIDCLDYQPFEMLSYRTISGVYKEKSSNIVIIETVTDLGIYEYFKVIKIF